MVSKKAKARLNASVMQRFPQGKTKGDTLGKTIYLGQSFRAPNPVTSSIPNPKGRKK